MAIQKLKKALNKRKNEEEQEQIALVKWLTLKKIPHFHIPNGGSRNLFEAVKFKQMGVKAGVPDICIPVPNNYHHGLYIEMKKRKGGALTEHQQNWLDLLIENGYCATACHGWNEARELVEKYLESSRIATATWFSLTHESQREVCEKLV